MTDDERFRELIALVDGDPEMQAADARLLRAERSGDRRAVQGAEEVCWEIAERLWREVGGHVRPDGSLALTAEPGRHTIPRRDA